jgi:hypothetical protein
MDQKNFSSSQYSQTMLDRFFAKKNPPVPGIGILLLERRLEVFLKHQLSLTMLRTWSQEYDAQKFFACSIFDGDDAVLKIRDAFYGIRHFETWLGTGRVGRYGTPTLGKSRGFLQQRICLC